MPRTLTDELVPLVYLGPFDEVVIADTGQLVARGDVVVVPAEIAGRPPAVIPDPDDDDKVEHVPGCGLLAQTDSWALALDREGVDEDDLTEADAAALLAGMAAAAGFPAPRVMPTASPTSSSTKGNA